MHRLINIMTLFFLGIFSFFAFGYVYDLSVSTYHMRQLPYLEEVQWSICAIVLTLGVLRIVRKWQGFSDMRSFQEFVYNVPISQNLFTYNVLFSFLELIFFGASIYFLNRININEISFLYGMMMILVFLGLELIIYIIVILQRGKSFRVGIGDDMVAFYNREMNLIPYQGVRRVELHENMINFHYSKKKNIFLPLSHIPPPKEKKFKDTLIEVLDAKNIFIDDDFRKSY